MEIAMVILIGVVGGVLGAALFQGFIALGSMFLWMIGR